MDCLRAVGPRLVFASLALTACAEPVFTAPDRAVGDRAPLERACDELDDTRCLLPWPSNAFTVSDPASPTGLRLSVDVRSFNRDDDGGVLSRADGFSRVSTVIAGFPARVDRATVGWDDPESPGAIHLFLAQHDHPDVGAEVALRAEVLLGEDMQEESLVIGHPLAPLEANADYVVVITDAIRGEDGAPIEASRGTQVALGLVAPGSQDEADLAGYHAPLRAFLEERGVEAEHVVRAWSFTTRSAEDPIRRLLAMRQAAIDAVESGDVEVAFDLVEHQETGAIASIIEGRLVGMPSHVAEDGLSIDESGAPLAIGVHDAPFRIVLPRGTGDYRVLMYGHGTGGNVHDDAFDEAIAEEGAAKVGIEYYGWTDTTVIDTFVALQNVVVGASVASAGLVQAAADASAIRRAMSGILGDALSAETLGGMPNPHVGRRPDDSIPIWVGGSLGGTMGLVFAGANAAEVDHVVLNVPGAGWGTWVRDAAQFGLIQPLISLANRGDLNVAIAIAIGQTMLDESDGASFVDVLEADPVVALVQESIGDPVLPNPGTHMVGQVVGAVQVGPVLTPIHGLERAAMTTDQSGLTQYRVAGTDELEIHGFAARDTPAADAAREQIFGFVRSTWAGTTTIEVPPTCITGTPDGSCDFSR